MLHWPWQRWPWYPLSYWRLLQRRHWPRLSLKLIDLLLHQAQLLLQRGNLGFCASRLCMRVSEDRHTQ
jgi:hypothetical protein